MSYTTTEMKIVIALATALSIAPMAILLPGEQEASGQLVSPIAEAGGATTYTHDDIAAGKADHLKDTNPIPIISKSMLPFFKVGEYATLNFTVPYESIEEGDIIVFDCKEETGKNMMHRVTEVKEYEDGSRALETVGDYNDGEQFDCEKKISHDEYLGKIIQEESISYSEAF